MSIRIKIEDQTVNRCTYLGRGINTEWKINGKIKRRK
jgi:hypothetical protein